MIRNLLTGPIASAALRTSSVLAIRLLAQAGTLLALAHLLRPEQFGGFAGISALAVLLGAVTTGGTHLTLLRALSRNEASGHAFLPLTLGTTLVCSCVLTAVYLVVCHTLMADIGVPVAVFYLIGIAELFVHPYLLIAAAERQSRGEVARSQAIIIAPLIPRLMLASALLITTPGDPLLFYASGYLLIHLFVAAVVIVAMPTRWPPVKHWRALPRNQWLDSLSFATAGLSNRAPTELDKTLSLQLLPLAVAASYAAASRTMGAIITPVIALILAAQPALFREPSACPAAKRLIPRLFLSALAYGSLVAALLWAFAPRIAELFGPDYAHFIEMARTLALATPALCLRITASNILMARGSPWARVLIECLGVAVLLGSATAFTTQHPILGLAMGYTLTEWTMAALGWSLLRKTHRTQNPPPHDEHGSPSNVR